MKTPNYQFRCNDCKYSGAITNVIDDCMTPELLREHSGHEAFIVTQTRGVNPLVRLKLGETATNDSKTTQMGDK
jgi:hypothetical protein